MIYMDLFVIISYTSRAYKYPAAAQLLQNRALNENRPSHPKRPLSDPVTPPGNSGVRTAKFRFARVTRANAESATHFILSRLRSVAAAATERIPVDPPEPLIFVAALL